MRIGCFEGVQFLCYKSRQSKLPGGSALNLCSNLPVTMSIFIITAKPCSIGPALCGDFLNTFSFDHLVSDLHGINKLLVIRVSQPIELNIILLLPLI